MGKKTELFWNPTPLCAFADIIRGNAYYLTELSQLPPEERVKAYRKLAQRCESCARLSKYEFSKQSYSTLAKQWLRLAEEIEAEITRVKP
jgi:hypothetical protein